MVVSGLATQIMEPGRVLRIAALGGHEDQVLVHPCRTRAGSCAASRSSRRRGRAAASAGRRGRGGRCARRWRGRSPCGRCISAAQQPPVVLDPVEVVHCARTLPADRRRASGLRLAAERQNTIGRLQDRESYSRGSEALQQHRGGAGWVQPAARRPRRAGAGTRRPPPAPPPGAGAGARWRSRAPRCAGCAGAARPAGRRRGCARGARPGARPARRTPVPWAASVLTIGTRQLAAASSGVRSRLASESTPRISRTIVSVSGWSALLMTIMSGISITPAFSAWIESPEPGISTSTIVSA